MDWLSNIFDYLADSTRLAWFSIAMTVFVAFISVKVTNRFTRKLSLINPDAIINNREQSDRLLDEARKLMGAKRLRGASPFGEVTKENLEQALIAILKARAKSPHYARAYYEHGVYEIRSERPDRAIPHIEKATALEPKNARYQCALGQVYRDSARSIYLSDGVAMGQGFFARPRAKLQLITRYWLSKRYLLKALKLDPELYIAHINLGVTLANRSKDKARKHFEIALQLEPDNQMPYLNLIRLYFHHGDFSEARIIAKQALKLHPENPTFIKQLKKIYAAENNFEQLKELEKLHPSHDSRSKNIQQEQSPTTNAFNPADTKSVYTIGSHPIVTQAKQYDKRVNTALEHLLNEHIDDARDLFKSLSNNYPAEPMYKLALADCALQNADYELATTYLNEANPAAQTDWYWRYICFSITYMKQDYSRAIEMAKSWWDADNNDMQALYMYCKASFVNQETSVALEVLDKVITSQTLENSDLLSIAEFYISADKPDQAEELLQSALETDPKNYKVHLIFCRLYQTQARYTRMSDYAHSAQTLGAERSVCSFYHAVSLANLGKTDEAIALFLECIQLNPKKPSYYLHLGYAYAERLNYAHAESAYKSASKLSPNWDQPFHALGELYLEMRSTTNALTTYEHLVKTNQHDSLAHFNLALCCEHAGQRDRAIKHYNRAIALGDQHHVTYFNLGHLYEHESHQLARHYYEKTLQLMPTYSPALFNIGIHYMERNRHQESLPYFEKAHKHDPDNLAYTERLAMAYYNAEHYESCITLANKIVAKDPENFIGWDCLGKSYVAQENIQSALHAFTTAAQLSDSRRVEFLNRIGNTHHDSGDNDSALKVYNDIIKTYPDDAAAYMNIGNVYFARENDKEALIWYDAATEKASDYAIPYFNRALIYNKREQFDLALEQLDAAIALDQKYASALNFKGAILMDDKHDLEYAKSVFELCVKVSPYNLYALTRLAQIHNQLHEYKQAVSCSNQAIEIQADSPAAYEQLFTACEALGRVEDGNHARAHLKRLETKDINTALIET